MPAYSYEAINASGKTQKGIIESDTVKTARSQLRGQALIPIEVVEVNANAKSLKKPASFNVTLWETKVFSATKLTIWTRQLASLVNSGLQIERALTALSEDAPPRELALISELRAEVNAGSSFAKALAKYPREFSDSFRAVVDAGEQGGSLDVVLEQLATDLEQQQALKSKIMGAALYPAIVISISIAIIVFLMSYIVPTVAEVFSKSKQSLPILTIIVMAASDFLREYWFYMLGVMLLVVVAFRLFLRRRQNRIKFDRLFFKLPIVGKLAQGYNAARFASTLAMLTSSGVPILKAIASAADTINNQAMREDALDVIVQVREGAPLAIALSGKKVFPSILSMFARLGEQTGNLPLMLQRGANQLSSNVQRKALQLATVMEPVLILVTGVLVMLIVLAVLLPIIELNQLIK